MECRHRPPFGFSPKISTPVENTVEKQVKWQRYRWKRLIYRYSGGGEGCRPIDFGPPHPPAADLPRLDVSFSGESQ
jgi:hypothetical protein